MAFIQRLFSLGFIPIIAIFALQMFSPDTFHAFQEAVQPYISGTPLSHFFPASNPPRSETPLIIASTTHWSHFEKIAAVAVELATLGYPITFLTGRIFEDATNKLHKNIKFQAFQGLDDKLTEEDMKTWKSLKGDEQEIFIMKKVLVDGMPDQHDSFQIAFREQQEKYGDSKPILFLFDQSVSGVFPIQFGVPGIRADADIGISIAPLTLESNDTYPFRSGKVPETGPDAKAKHWAAYQMMKKDKFNLDLNEHWWAKLRTMGATRKEFPYIMQAMNSEAHYLLTMGIPQFEFQRSDLRPNVRWYGAFTKVGKNGDGELNLPEWWNEIDEAKKAGKKIVAVSQGTVETDLSQILMPTIEGLKDRDDILLIASTVAVEPEDVEGLLPVPKNTKVAKFVPYDLLLPKVCRIGT
jgi:UDP:flavonoid glycosyltransferase YjiC (YdhE family)